MMGAAQPQQVRLGGHDAVLGEDIGALLGAIAAFDDVPSNGITAADAPPALLAQKVMEVGVSVPVASYDAVATTKALEGAARLQMAHEVFLRHLYEAAARNAAALAFTLPTGCRCIGSMAQFDAHRTDRRAFFGVVYNLEHAANRWRPTHSTEGPVSSRLRGRNALIGLEALRAAEYHPGRRHDKPLISVLCHAIALDDTCGPQLTHAAWLSAQALGLQHPKLRQALQERASVSHGGIVTPPVIPDDRSREDEVSYNDLMVDRVRMEEPPSRLWSGGENEGLVPPPENLVNETTRLLRNPYRLKS
jgi:hypothetical protein